MSRLALELPAGLVERVLSELAELPAVRAVALAGSFARGTAREDSDVDFGVFYDEAAPPSLDRVRSAARRLHDAKEDAPVVTAPYEWGPFVNGGAWLVVGGRRVAALSQSRPSAPCGRRLPSGPHRVSLRTAAPLWLFQLELPWGLARVSRAA
ncbi:MAG TPA: nucleotidyltransferase domain-containing protein [Myxococcota bacterium]|nr:nucleotidyltransferase domain-containing protein [Myxococcota bacterium]